MSTVMQSETLETHRANPGRWSVPRLSALCAYYGVLRRVRERLSPRVWRMRTSRSEFYSDMWRRAVENSGATLTALSDGTTRIERNGTCIDVQNNITSLDSSATRSRAEDKPSIRTLLRASGVPVPEGILIGFGEFAKAVDLLRSSSGPLVVKPGEATSGGAGVTMNVTEIRQLEVAFAWARSFGPQVAIERQIAGDCYRVLVMDGEVLDTVLRHPPRVIGDGRSTVFQLILCENRFRLEAGAKRAQVLIGFDPDLRNMLATRGFSLSSRPAAGEVIALKGVINDNGGKDNVPANGTLCAAILQSACTAARIVGARLAGIDIICSDPSLPLESSGGAVVDVHAAPGLYYHYHRADSSVPIADRVLRKAFNLSTAL